MRWRVTLKAYKALLMILKFLKIRTARHIYMLKRISIFIFTSYLSRRQGAEAEAAEATKAEAVETVTAVTAVTAIRRSK